MPTTLEATEYLQKTESYSHLVKLLTLVELLHLLLKCLRTAKD